MHGPVYITEKQVKLAAKAKSDVVIVDARPDGRLKIDLGDGNEAQWYDANAKPLEGRRWYRMLAVKHYGDGLDAGARVFSDYGVQLLPIDREQARAQAREQLLPEVDNVEFILIPTTERDNEVKVDALPPEAEGDGLPEWLPKLVTFDDANEWDEARLSETAFDSELWVKVKDNDLPGVAVGVPPDMLRVEELIGIVTAYDPEAKFTVDVYANASESAIRYAGDTSLGVVGTLRGVPFDALTALGVTDE